MYTHSMIRINRSPESGEGGGSLPESASPEAAPAAAAPEYISKSDFESFRNEITGHISRLTPKEQAREESKVDSGDPREPDASKYDFSKPGELSRYNRDNYKWLRSQDRAEEAKESEARQAEEKSKKDIQGHQARTIEYTKTNPSYAADMKAAAGRINVIDAVAKAVYGSRNGHLAVHYMAKNPGSDQELNLLADSDGPDAVRERIGEMAAEMRAEAKALEGNTLAASQKPPRFSTRGTVTGAAKKPTAAERFARFQS
jgi:hypothetical protein